MITYKTKEEIEIMAKGGIILGEILNKIVEKVKPGISTGELDSFADEQIRINKAQASFKTVRDYKWATCMCVNDVVVHGIPQNSEILKDGDILGIDIGLLYKGFHTDISTSRIVGKLKDKNVLDFLMTGKNALEEAIKLAIPGNYVYDISKSIQTNIQEKGYGIVRQLVGHGVGIKLHEDPQIPGWVQKGEKREESEGLKPGMTIAIEIIYTMGSEKIVYKNRDGWTIVTQDGNIAGLFEKTVAIEEHGVRIITPFKDTVL